MDTRDEKLTQRKNDAKKLALKKKLSQRIKNCYNGTKIVTADKNCSNELNCPIGLKDSSGAPTIIFRNHPHGFALSINQKPSSLIELPQSPDSRLNLIRDRTCPTPRGVANMRLEFAGNQKAANPFSAFASLVSKSSSSFHPLSFPLFRVSRLRRNSFSSCGFPSSRSSVGINVEPICSSSRAAIQF